ncbi:HEAT repeat domain-containing protein [Paludisphaera rhizosphaerae]|uniref:HEAT repeat domain-containing protein n=1 Tax=Paludisphaera rhizosphaerae TaxID=2711216 RepID=UPI0013EE347E|nr:HEAT repeat domain-containing protein [Paludisphaera rhizosphaerae]
MGCSSSVRIASARPGRAGRLALPLLLAAMLAGCGESGEPPIEPPSGFPSAKLAESLRAVAASAAAAKATPVSAPTADAPSTSPTPAPASTSTPAAPLTSAEIVARVEPSVAVVRGKGKTGTGFMVAPGLLATNAHVIEGANSKDLEVRFPSAPDGKKGPFPAEVVFRRRGRDLAILKVAADLPPLEIADAYKFQKGADVLVIGNPGFGKDMVLENAVSRGVMSTKAAIEGRDYYQMSIAINPGNSGGPVVDGAGKVVGVATLKSNLLEGTAFCVPADDLRTVITQATTPGGPAPDSAESVGSAGLRYAWKPGQTYVYSVTATYEAGKEVVVLQGSSIYRARDAEADGVKLAHSGWLVTRRRPKNPGLGAKSQVQSPAAPSRVEMILDEQGNVTTEFQGAIPLPLLGDLALLAIEPLPEGSEDRWDDEHPISLNISRTTPGSSASPFRFERPSLLESRMRSRLRPGIRPGIRTRPGISVRPAPAQVQVEAHPGRETSEFTRKSLADGRATIAKTYNLRTDDIVGAGPMLEVSGEGTFTFDVNEGVPAGLEFHGQIVQNTENETLRIPVRVECRRLEGAERDLAMRFPAVPPTAMTPIDADDVKQALAGLKSSDAGKRREAANFLRDGTPVETRRDAVAQALKGLLNDGDGSIRAAAVQALGVWGGPAAPSWLLARLDDDRFGARDEVFEALARLTPDDKSAAAVASKLKGDDRGRAARTLRAWGSAAEPALLGLVDGSEPMETRSEACRILKDVGTSRSESVLRRLAQAASGEEMGRAAESAARAIERRRMTEADVAATLADLNSGEVRRRREAADRLAAVAPIADRRATVAQTLAENVDDPDVFARGAIVKALRNWSDPAAAKPLFEKLKNPKFQGWREAIEILGSLGPKAQTEAVEAVASRVKDDRGLVFRVLQEIGPPALPVLIRLADPKGDTDVRREALQALGRVADPSVLPLLRAAAAEKDKAFLVMAANGAIRDVERRNLSPKELNDLIGRLKASDPNQRRDPLRRLTEVHLDDARRAQVVAALKPLLLDSEEWTQGDALRALRSQGGAEALDALREAAANPAFRPWRDAVQALAEETPTPAVAELVVGRMGDDRGHCIRTLEKIGPVAGPVVLKAFQESSDSKERLELCRLLERVGGPEALGALHEMTSQKESGALAHLAEDALRGIDERK